MMITASVAQLVMRNTWNRSHIDIVGSNPPLAFSCFWRIARATRLQITIFKKKKKKNSNNYNAMSRTQKGRGSWPCLDHSAGGALGELPDRGRLRTEAAAPRLPQRPPPLEWGEEESRVVINGLVWYSFPDWHEFVFEQAFMCKIIQPPPLEKEVRNLQG